MTPFPSFAQKHAAIEAEKREKKPAPRNVPVLAHQTCQNRSESTEIKVSRILLRFLALFALRALRIGVIAIL